MALDPQDIAEAGAAGLALTQMAKESVFEKWKQIPREFLVPLPLFFGIVYLVIKYLADGKTTMQAILNGILGGIASMLVYKGLVAEPRMRDRMNEQEEQIRKLEDIVS